MADAPKYVVSSPARFAAEVLDAHFEITAVRDGITAPTVENVAKIIDLKTKAYKVKPVLQDVFSKVDYLSPDPNEIRRNIDVVRESLRAIELVSNSLPRWEDESEELFREEIGQEARMGSAERERHREMADRYQVSAEAASAVRELSIRFDFIERPEGQITCTENNLCILIDTCTNMWLVHERLMRLVAATNNLDAVGLAQQMPIVKSLFRDLKYAFHKMPAGKQPLNIGRYRRTDISGMLTSQQIANRRIVEGALSKARTPQQANQILIDASKDKLL